jgi:glycosyltransferase involved in cell wall biosynthesis
MKKVCFVSPYAFPLLIPNGKGPGGAERQFFLFARELAAQGWDVSFVTAHPPKNSENQQTTFPVYTCSLNYLGGSNRSILTDWFSLLRAMKKAGSYYYVLKVPGHLLAPMAFFCRLFKRHLVFWGQMSYDADPAIRSAKSFVGVLHDFGIKKTNTVIAQTLEQQQGFSKNYKINAFIVPSICSNIESQDAYPLEKATNKKQIDVLWAGNSTPKKRYEVVVELAKMMPQIQFAMAMNKANPGRFQEAQIICRSIANLDFLGTVQPAIMEQIFPQTKLFLNTSTQEGFPNTYLQAWQSKIPVVTLNIDPDNVIAKHSLGVVIDQKLSSESYDSRILAAMLVDPIKKLLRNPTQRLQMGKNAQDYVTNTHTPERVTRLLESILLRNKHCVKSYQQEKKP